MTVHTATGIISQTTGNDNTYSVPLTPNGTLYAASLVDWANNYAPVYGALILRPAQIAAIDAGQDSEGILLDGGWIRSTWGSPAGTRGLSWQGHQPLGNQPTLFIFLRNDTGSTVPVRWSISEDRK